MNQFGRRNLSAGTRSILALRLEPIMAKRAKERQLSKLKQNSSDTPKSAERESPKGETRNEIAKIAGVGHDTIDKVKGMNSIQTLYRAQEAAISSETALQ